MSSLDTTRQQVLQVLEEVLGLGGRTASFDDETPLLGAVPELDSMAVVGVIAALEEHFGFHLADDDIDGSTFETVGSLSAFVAAKLAA
ncbi:acyl carrier protein [Uliginosibacterium paludis]|uniref:Acyl carrier protein n=1 Tax=Uliginosibacterium paludis TaxID=1615952 RepID=A0ABV2CKW2_9RHOO